MLDKRRTKKQRRAEKRAAAATQPGAAAASGEEEDDFEAEYKMLKKLKSGKVSAAEFDAAIQLNDIESDEG